MKRYIEITGEITLDNYASKIFEIVVKVTQDDLILLLPEFQLLIYDKIDSLKIKSKQTSKCLTISINNTLENPTIDFVKDNYFVILSSINCGRILSFLLEYYRDTYAPISHIHLDLKKIGEKNLEGILTFFVHEFRDPISGDEVSKLLDL